MKHLLFSSHFVNFYRKSTKSTALTETHQTVLNCSNGILFFLMALYRLSWIISVINSSLETVRHQQLDIFVKGHFFTFYLSPSGWHWRRCVSEPKWWRAWFTWRAREQSFVPWRHNSSGFIRAVWDETHHKQFYIYADSSDYRSPCWREWQLGAVVFVVCVMFHNPPPSPSHALVACS